jgi:hypothetical protein
VKHRSGTNRRSRGSVALRSAVAVGALAGGALALWYAIHHVPWLGPALADGARAVVGPAPVAWAEDTLYGWQDRWNRWRHGDAAPVTYWAAPSVSALVPTSVGPAPAAQLAATPGFPPPPVTPPCDRVAAPGDGQWQVAASAGHGPVMYKTVLHPDAKRPFAALAVVVMDLAKLRLRATPGLSEPRPKSPIPGDVRTGLVHERDLDTLLAVFNGGFLTLHGNYGMMVDGRRLIEPRPTSCTIAIYRDGTMRIRSWPEVEKTEPQMEAFRQTPQCLVEQGRYNPALHSENTAWGAAVGGNTVIRRSALGMSQDGALVYFGMGDALTAKSVADGMQAAGAYDIAQLDVNHSFPRFMFYNKNPEVPGEFLVTGLIPNFTFTPADYVKKASFRDFFYVTRREPAAS